jgi:hypothetical protein
MTLGGRRSAAQRAVLITTERKQEASLLDGLKALDV